MRHFLMMVLLLAGVQLHAEETCWDKLLQQGDSRAIAFSAVDIELRRTNLVSIVYSMAQAQGCGENPKLDLIELKGACREIVEGEGHTLSCYIPGDRGYFILNKDYMDTINILVNRWD